MNILGPFFYYFHTFLLFLLGGGAPCWRRERKKMRILCETGDGDLIFFSAAKKLEKRLTNKGGNDHPLLTVF
jgi:hypothetical protein